VWPDYRWLVPLFLDMLREFWPEHPEVVSTQHAGEGRNWTMNLLSGVQDAKCRGYDSVFLINEEHFPISKCNHQYLSETLIGQAEKLDASYISLFGWDNKRFCSKSLRLGADYGMWMHLSGEKDPRFHLHPAWWRLDALEACCNLVLKDGGANGSAWHFEKTCDDPDAEVAEVFRNGCYQISAAMTREPQISAFQFRLRLVHRWITNKAMAVLPHLQDRGLRSAWMKFWDFDDVVSDGAYPMVFSGILSKGRLNPAFLKYCLRNCSMEKWLSRIQDSMKESQKC
jgi:hypothetical protein